MAVIAIAIVNFEAFKKGKIAVVDPILTFELPITIGLAVILLQEQLAALQIALSSLLFFGIVLISVSNGNFKSRHFLEKGALLAVAAAIGLGFANFVTGVLARALSPLIVIWTVWTIVAAFCFLYLLAKGKVGKMLRDAKASSKIVFAESFFDTSAWIFYAFALVNLPIALATGIVESYPAIAILLGILVNREIVKRHQFVGMGIALACSFALAILFG